MEDKPQTVDRAHAAEDEAPQGGAKGWIYHSLSGFYASRDSLRKHPVWGTLLAALILVIGVAGSEAYQYVRGKLVGPDEFLVQISDAQTRQFEELKANLQAIRGSLGDDGRDAFREVQDAVQVLERNNDGLIRQLALAKQENETLRKVAQERAGVSGGYDVILAENHGLRLDASTVLGVTDVRTGGSYVNLTSQDEEQARYAYLRSGESMSYRAADGRSCKLSLLSVSPGTVGTASFVLGCS